MRILLGLFAALPLLMIGLVFFVLSRVDGFWPDWFWFGFPALFLTGVALYLWNVWHNSAIPHEKRALWTALIIFGNMYVLPFYFAFYVWPRRPVPDLHVPPN